MPGINDTPDRESYPKLLTSLQAAAYIGISHDTLTKWVKQNHIKHLVMPSGRRMYRTADLDAALEKWVRP